MATRPSEGNPSKYEEEPSATTGEQEQPDHHHQKARDDHVVVAPPKLPQSDVQLVLTPTDNRTINLPRKGHVDINRYCTKLCRNFIAHGSCPFAQNCIFAHGEHQLRPLGSLLVQQGEGEQSQPHNRVQQQLPFHGQPPPTSIAPAVMDPSGLTMMLQRVSVGGGGGVGGSLMQQQQQHQPTTPHHQIAVYPPSYYGGGQPQPVPAPVSQSFQQQLLPSFSTILQQPTAHPQQQMFVLPQQQQQQHQVGLHHQLSPMQPESLLPSLHPVMTGQSPQQQLTLLQPLAQPPPQPVLSPAVVPPQHAQGGSVPMLVPMVSPQEQQWPQQQQQQQQQQQASQLQAHNELPLQRSATLQPQQQQLHAVLPSSQPSQFYVVN